MNEKTLQIQVEQMGQSIAVLRQQRDAVEDERDQLVAETDSVIAKMHIRAQQQEETIQQRDDAFVRLTEDYCKLKARLENRIDGLRKDLRFAREQCGKRDLMIGGLHMDLKKANAELEQSDERKRIVLEMQAEYGVHNDR